MNITSISTNYQQKQNIQTTPAFKAKLAFDPEALEVLRTEFAESFPRLGNNKKAFREFVKSVKGRFEDLTAYIKNTVFKIGVDLGESTDDTPVFLLTEVKKGKSTHTPIYPDAVDAAIPNKTGTDVQETASDKAKLFIYGVADAVKSMEETFSSIVEGGRQFTTYEDAKVSEPVIREIADKMMPLSVSIAEEFDKPNLYLLHEIADPTP